MSSDLQIKVCGNTHAQNLKSVCDLQPDFIGFIFYDKSKRFVDSADEMKQPLGADAKRVGVFVNASEQEISQRVEKFNLDYIQLHGDETPEFCAIINNIRPVFKAFQINNNFNFNILKDYLSTCYAFLFDTSSNQYGGSGEKFDWGLLQRYNFKKPFMLSGGINDHDVEIINSFDHPSIMGIDLNSKFESSPGIKNITKLSKFLSKLRL